MTGGAPAARSSIAREVVYEIDLPEIIRESTGIVTSEAVVGVRMQGIQADERVIEAYFGR